MQGTTIENYHNRIACRRPRCLLVMPLLPLLAGGSAGTTYVALLGGRLWSLRDRRLFDFDMARVVGGV